MTSKPVDEEFVRLIRALGPFLSNVVFVGGWAHRLLRLHPLAQDVPYQPLMTVDADVAFPAVKVQTSESLLKRMEAAGFHEYLVVDGSPPVTRYFLDASSFYAEFLTPQVGGSRKRDETEDLTALIAGVSAQKLPHLGILLVEPWSVEFQDTGKSLTIQIPNAVSFVAHKLIISNRRNEKDRAKDLLYIHDTIELFAASLPELRQLWVERVQPSLGSREKTKLSQARKTMFEEVTDAIREAARMGSGRSLRPETLLETCQEGLARIFG